MITSDSPQQNDISEAKVENPASDVPQENLWQDLAENPVKWLTQDYAKQVRILLEKARIEQKWPAGQPDKAFTTIVESIRSERQQQRDPDSAKCKAATHILVGLLSETGHVSDTQNPERDFFLPAHKSLVEKIIEALERDTAREGKPADANAYPIALGAAAYISLVRDNSQRLQVSNYRQSR